MPDDNRPTSDEMLKSKRLAQQLTRQVHSSDLFAGGHEVLILHAGETYRLRKTRSGKLILTK